MFSLLPWERTLVAASHVAPTVVLPQGPQGWGSAYTLFPNRSAEMTDGSEKRKHQLTFELQSSRVFKTLLRWGVHYHRKSHDQLQPEFFLEARENPANEIIEESNFSDFPVVQPQNKRYRYEMRNCYEACQISLLYVCLFDGAQRSMTFLSFCFFFVCLLLLFHNVALIYSINFLTIF